MATPRKHTTEYKKKIVEELISGTTTLGQIIRRDNLAPSMVRNWKDRYLSGALMETPSDPKQTARIAELERMVGRLTMEIDLLKKAATSIQQQRRNALLPITAKTLTELNGGAKS
jgi:transposase